MRRKRMHGRRRRRSPVKSWGSDNGAWSKILSKFKGDKSDDDSSENPSAKVNAMEAKTRAIDVTEENKPNNLDSGSNDNSHSHPPVAFEEKENEEGGDVNSFDKNSARRRAQEGMRGRANRGSWGQNMMNW